MQEVARGIDQQQQELKIAAQKWTVLMNAVQSFGAKTCRFGAKSKSSL